MQQPPLSDLPSRCLLTLWNNCTALKANQTHIHYWIMAHEGLNSMPQKISNLSLSSSILSSSKKGKKWFWALTNSRAKNWNNGIDMHLINCRMDVSLFDDIVFNFEKREVISAAEFFSACLIFLEIFIIKWKTISLIEISQNMGGFFPIRFYTVQWPISIFSGYPWRWYIT